MSDLMKERCDLKQMIESLFEHFRLLLRGSPLDAAASWELVLKLCVGRILSDDMHPPFEICGHVQARPPFELYVSVVVLAVCALLHRLYRLIIRLWSIRRRYSLMS